MFAIIIQTALIILIAITILAILVMMQLTYQTIFPILNHNPYPTAFTLTELENQVIHQINQYRTQLDLPPFKLNDYLSTMAEYHTINMVINQIITSEGMVEIEQQIKQKTKCNEVQHLLSKAYQSSQGILELWEKDDQYDNILKADFKQIGIAILNDTKSRPYCTVILIN